MSEWEDELEEQRLAADQFVHDSCCETFENLYSRLDSDDQMTLQMVLGEAGEDDPTVPLDELRAIAKRLQLPDEPGPRLFWLQQSDGVFHGYLEGDGKPSLIGEMVPAEDRGMVWRRSQDSPGVPEGAVYASFRKRLERLSIWG